MDVQEQIKLINEEINEIDFAREPPELYEPIRYILCNGGKRLRPLLTLFGCHLFSDDYQKALKPGIGVEIFHNFTLVHDDIMDQAPIRRGKKTIHEKWNRNIAILSGDTMLIKCYDYLLSANDVSAKKVISLFNKCATHVCEGQQMDMNFENRPEITEEEYLHMIRLKTAALLGFSLQLGALIGGADDRNADLLKEFGLALGTGFQLKDDLLDVYGDESTFGKQVGGDIIANKKTYLLIQALNKSTSEQRKVLDYWLERNQPADEKIEQITGIYDQIGIRELTREKIDEQFRTGFQHLDRVRCKPDRKQRLRKFTQTLMDRDR